MGYFPNSLHHFLELLVKEPIWKKDKISRPDLKQNKTDLGLDWTKSKGEGTKSINSPFLKTHWSLGRRNDDISKPLQSGLTWRRIKL